MEWLERHARFHVHFTPTSASWLNLAESWFSVLTRQAIRRGSFDSVARLERAITQYIAEWNEHAEPFRWTTPVRELRRKIRRVKATSVTEHRRPSVRRVNIHLCDTIRTDFVHILETESLAIEPSFILREGSSRPSAARRHCTLAGLRQSDRQPAVTVLREETPGVGTAQVAMRSKQCRPQRPTGDGGRPHSARGRAAMERL